VGSGLAVLLVGGGAVVAVAGTPAVFRQDNGVVAVDASQLHKYAYQGHEISAAQLKQLQAQGKATLSLITREGACNGDVLWFDTQAELTAFQADSMARRSQAAVAGIKDPCAFAKTPQPIPTASAAS
jgi:hypothetical protein